MYFTRGKIAGQSVDIPFIRVATEYLVASDQERWHHVPHIISWGDPEGEGLIRDAIANLASTFNPPSNLDQNMSPIRLNLLAADHVRANKQDFLKKRRNFAIGMDQHEQDILDFLEELRGNIVPETITKLRRDRYARHIGIQISNEGIEQFRANPYLDFCTIQKVGFPDISRVLSASPAGVARPRLS